MARHREGDFDFHTFLSQTILYVTEIPICSRIEEPETPTIVDTQVIQDLEEHIEVRRPKTDAFAQCCKWQYSKRLSSCTNTFLTRPVQSRGQDKFTGRINPR